MSSAEPSRLAVDGGPPVRSTPLPPRRLFGQAELDAVTEVFHASWRDGVDFGYQGEFERRYTERFCEFQGGGFADAVASGTGGIFIALQALGIGAGDVVLMSPVTDPGSVAPALLLGARITIADSAPGTFNVGIEQFERALTPETRVAVLTHVGGHPMDIGPIAPLARERGVFLVEDCSQAHGALYCGERVGRFGDIAVFSTMFSKNHSTGGSGAIVYTTNEDYYWRIRACADRGKPFHSASFNMREPASFRWPALNLNLDELSCAIGASTLGRLQTIIEQRLTIANGIDEGLRARSTAVRPCRRLECTVPSLFFHTVEVEPSLLRVPKRDFAVAVAAEGIAVNPDYRYLVADWEWAVPAGSQATPNARAYRDQTFNILFNERFGSAEVADIVEGICKVESVLAASAPGVS